MQGTVSALLPYMDHDFINNDHESYYSWPFIPIHASLGRRSVDTYHVIYYFIPQSQHPDVTLYGTIETPAAVASIPSTCHPYCARGCSGPTTADYDVHRDYRLNSTLKCVTAYPQSTNERNKYCLAHQFDEDQYYAIAS